MRRQNRSDSVNVLESRKDIVGKSEKKKSKRVIMDADQGKRKCVVEDEVNLGVKPKKKTRFRRQKKLKFLTKFVSLGSSIFQLVSRFLLLIGHHTLMWTLYRFYGQS
ncbi:PREDICTED: uncharacterized protein LOC109209742 [Nicotiana attenuata]|uniref:uncharacterized protein LOC109209742 n=1 Tax=Nicotiana attenuata TaxID=49451 RepID=UPI000904D8DC|nr:PREDICTED: uncharacterized protein LOC109209742 [Nicotiana attenuata]